MIDSELLNKEIKELGIKQAVLAEKCGVSRQTISNWLDNTDLISAYHARILADVLRINEPAKQLAIFFAPNVEESSAE